MAADISRLLEHLRQGDPRAVGRAISLAENRDPGAAALLAGLDSQAIGDGLVLGVTGPPGAGKSTLSAALTRVLRERGQRVGIIAIDPSSPISGGALLGDRIRMMDHALDPQVLIRSMATRGRLGGLSAAAGAAVRIMLAGGCRTVLIETVGIGQSEMDIVRLADITMMVLAPGFGDEIQAMKAGILEVCDLLVVNKADQPGSERLLLDMAQLFGREGEVDSRLLRTASGTGEGVEALVERIERLALKLRDSGRFRDRRRRSFAMEALDWLQEMMRPRLETLVAAENSEEDPYLAARRIIQHLEQQSGTAWVEDND